MATRQCQILFPTLQVGVVRVYVKSGFFLPVPVLLLLLQGIYNTIHGPPRAQKCLGPRYFYSFLGTRPGPWSHGPLVPGPLVPGPMGSLGGSHSNMDLLRA